MLFSLFSNQSYQLYAWEAGARKKWQKVLRSSKAPCQRTQHCWLLHVASVCTPCCLLLRIVQPAWQTLGSSGHKKKRAREGDTPSPVLSFAHYFQAPATQATYCWELLRAVWNRSIFWANNSQHFFRSVIAEAFRNNVRSVCTALPTFVSATHMHYT